MDLLFFPIDTLKTRLQSSQGFRRAGGLSGVYKGVGSVVVGSAPGGISFIDLSNLKYSDSTSLKLRLFSQRTRQ